MKARNTFESIVLKTLIFNTAEKREYEQMTRDSFNPTFVKFSRGACGHDIIKHYTNEKTKLISYFQNLNYQVSLIFDICIFRQRIV